MAENENPIPLLKNSKKISQIRGRDTITYNQDHSWLVLAQYDSRIGAYHNITMNLSAITSYAIQNADVNTAYYVESNINNVIDAYNLEELKKLAYVGEQNDYESIGYALTYTSIGSNLVSYAHSYTMNMMMWQYFPNKTDTFNLTKYIFTEAGEYLLTDKGKKMLV